MEEYLNTTTGHHDGQKKERREEGGGGNIITLVIYSSSFTTPMMIHYIISRRSIPDDLFAASNAGTFLPTQPLARQPSVGPRAVRCCRPILVFGNGSAFILPRDRVSYPRERVTWSQLVVLATPRV